MGKKKEIIDPVYDSAQRISYVVMHTIDDIQMDLNLGNLGFVQSELQKLQQYCAEQYKLIMEEKHSKTKKTKRK
jgi:hypothetical protein